MRNKSTNRTGRVSSVDYERGTYTVTYWDRGGSVTKQVNGIANGQYKMPKVGQVVTVNHNSNGTEAAISAGNIWNSSNRPVKGQKGCYRQEFGDTVGKAFQTYDENTGTHETCVDKLFRLLCNGDIYQQAKGALKLLCSGAMSLSSTAGTASISGKTGVALSSGKSIDVEAGEGWTLSATAASEEVFGAELNRTVTGKMQETLEDDFEQTIQGDKTVTLKGDLTILLAGAQVKITQAGDVTITARRLKADLDSIEVTATSGSIKVDGVSLTKHTHKDGGAGEPEKEDA